MVAITINFIIALWAEGWKPSGIGDAWTVNIWFDGEYKEEKPLYGSLPLDVLQFLSYCT